MKAIETVLHLRRQRPAMMRNMIPRHVWALVERYGLKPRPDETRDSLAPPPPDAQNPATPEGPRP
jgi:coenzyme F420 hydrogenase subunit beta